MDSIFKLLKDPSWWFTIILIGILASLAAAYLRDWISLLASHLSQKAKLRRDQRLARENEFRQLLLADSNLLIVELLLTLLSVICFLALTFFYISLPSVTDSLSRLYVSKHPSTESTSAYWDIIQYGWLALGLLANYVGFRTMMRLRLAIKAKREYERSVKRVKERKSRATK